MFLHCVCASFLSSLKAERRLAWSPLIQTGHACVQQRVQCHSYHLTLFITFVLKTRKLARKLWRRAKSHALECYNTCQAHSLLIVYSSHRCYKRQLSKCHGKTSCTLSWIMHSTSRAISLALPNRSQALIVMVTSHPCCEDIPSCDLRVKYHGYIQSCTHR